MIEVKIDTYVPSRSVRGFMIETKGDVEIMKTRPSETGWRLHDTLHEWIVDRGGTYGIRWKRDDGWYLAFEDHNLAMLFKLTWV